MAQVNPPLPNEQGPYNPKDRVTGLFAVHDAVTTALRDLGAAGVVHRDIDIFSGPEGEHLLNPTGESGGIAARWYRTVEQWVSDTSAFQELAAATLKAGGFLVAVHVGGNAALKETVMSLLTQAGATDVKYWSDLYVEQGHEDRPQSPAGPA
jgi:hypothetical protein